VWGCRFGTVELPCRRYRYIQGTFRERLGNIQGTSGEHPGNIQGTSREHPGNIQGLPEIVDRDGDFVKGFDQMDVQGTFTEHLGNGREHPRNIQGTFRERYGLPEIVD
jgi:hypothetical protein